MTGRTMGATAALVAALLSGGQGSILSARAPVPTGPTAATIAPGAIQRHHYTMSARVRPLLLFWIGRANVGDAIVTRAAAPDETRYSLLIGSDPDRAPRRINRWGYVEERVRGTSATVVGLMTQSDEESVEEAEASFRREGSGAHVFKVIHAAVDAEQSRSIVTAVSSPADYSFHQVRDVLALVGEGEPDQKARVVQLPRGTRPGFLSALTEIIHAQAESARAGAVRAGAPLIYVYHGKFYELRSTGAQLNPKFAVNASRYERVVTGQFLLKSLADGDEERFTLSYGIDGSLAEVPLTMSYQPRWWMQINLALADDVAGMP